MVHRYFCCSDTHGRLPDLPDRANGKCDATFHAGDIYNGAELTRGRHDPQEIAGVAGWVDPEVATVHRWLDQAGPVYVVRGNHDLADPHDFFQRAQEVIGRVARVSELLVVAGLGWHGERYYELPGEAEMIRVCDAVRWQLRRLAGPRDGVILVTHYPPKLPELYPYRIPEVGWWHDCTRALVEEVCPVLVVQGHIHELAGESAEFPGGRATTLIVSPGKRGTVLEIDASARQARVVSVL